jgi:hypothetical protein
MSEPEITERPELRQGAIVSVQDHNGVPYVGIVTNYQKQAQPPYVRVVGPNESWYGRFAPADVEFIEQASGNKHMTARREALAAFVARHPEWHQQAESGQPDKLREKTANA